MKPYPIKTGKMFRDFSFGRENINEEKRTVSLAFSSELSVERWFGDEVLSHEPSHVRISRLQDGGALLVDHDSTDHVGVIESATIDPDRKGRAVVRFGKSQRASEVWQDVLDGIRTHVSVGYIIHELQEEQRASSEVEVFRAIDWEPLEVSLVSIPADHSVGVFRDKGTSISINTTVHRTQSEEESHVNMNEESTPVDKVDAPVAPESSRKVDVQLVREDARREELERIKSIESLGANHDNVELARDFIQSGKSVDHFRSALLERVGEAVPSDSGKIGMSEKEVGQFSFQRAINALANPHDRRAQEDAAFEFECSRAACDRNGVESRGVRVPDDIMSRANDYNATTNSEGGFTVGTELTGFIDVLRNTSVALSRGTVLSGLVGNVAIPRQTGGATAYWLAEGGAITDSIGSFDQVTLTPKTVGAWCDVTRKLTQQSSLDIEGLIRNDLAQTLGTALDLAAINGSGSSNQPTGILNTTGIGAVALGTNGGAPTWVSLVDLETAVSIDNALDGDLTYLTNYLMNGKLKQTSKVSSTDSFMAIEDGESNGYEVLVSNQVPNALTKGTSSDCSAIIFGNWSDLLVGMWGGLDLTVDPYSESTKGTIRVVAFQDVDIAVRHAESFAAIKDARNV